MPESHPDTAQEFLRLCLRAHGNTTTQDAVHAFATRSALDWNAVHRIADAQRIAPLIYHVLREEDFVPRSTAEALRDAYHVAAGRNLIFLHELRTVLRRLAAEDVPVIVLKGAALAETVYQKIALRPMADIDLLVHQHDLTASLEVLAKLGFARPRVETRTGATAAYENELILYKTAATRVPLEIHWGLFDSPFYQHVIPMDWFWETARPFRIDDTPALMLGLEAQLLHLSGHLHLHHTGNELLWLHDVAQLIIANQERINWNELLARMLQYQLVLPVQLVLRRVKDVWAAPIPDHVVERLSAVQPSRAEARTFTWLTTENRSVARRLWVDVASMPGWRGRLHFAWTALFPSVAYMQQRYHISHPLLVPFYYPYRWLRGIRSAV